MPPQLKHAPLQQVQRSMHARQAVHNWTVISSSVFCSFVSLSTVRCGTQAGSTGSRCYPLNHGPTVPTRFLFFSILHIFSCVWVFVCMFVYLCTTCVPAPVEARRRCVARRFLGWVKRGGKTYSKSGQHRSLDWGPGRIRRRKQAAHQRSSPSARD